VIKIRYPEGSISGAEYLGSFRPFHPPPNGNTPRHEEIEGIAIVTHKGMTVLLLALRGGKIKRDDKEIPGQLIWGTLSDIESPGPIFKKSETCPAPLSRNAIGDRGAADLYVSTSPSTHGKFLALPPQIQERSDLFDPQYTLGER
jgi:hypothetical protein